MNVRKQRTHQCGLTNIDYRTKGDHAAVDRYNPSLTYADTGTMNKSLFRPKLPDEAPFVEKWKTTGGWLPTKQPDPRHENTVNFYIDRDKKFKETANMANKHAELETDKWTDKVFTGDNVGFTQKLVTGALTRESAFKRGGRNIMEGADSDKGA